MGLDKEKHAFSNGDQPVTRIRYTENCSYLCTCDDLFRYPKEYCHRSGYQSCWGVNRSCMKLWCQWLLHCNLLHQSFVSRWKRLFTDRRGGTQYFGLWSTSIDSRVREPFKLIADHKPFKWSMAAVNCKSKPSAHIERSVLRRKPYPVCSTMQTMVRKSCWLPFLSWS